MVERYNSTGKQGTLAVAPAAGAAVGDGMIDPDGAGSVEMHILPYTTAFDKSSTVSRIPLSR